jgi:hypothetical protein
VLQHNTCGGRGEARWEAGRGVWFGWAEGHGNKCANINTQLHAKAVAKHVNYRNWWRATFPLSMTGVIESEPPHTPL